MVMTMRERLMLWFVKWVLRPKWVVIDNPTYADSPELMLQICGICVGLYKGDPLFYKGLPTRPPHKREFGESLHPA